MEKNEKFLTDLSLKKILIDNKITHAKKGEKSGQLQSEHFCGCCKTIKGKLKGFVLHLYLKTPGSQIINYKKLLAAPLVNGHNIHLNLFVSLLKPSGDTKSIFNTLYRKVLTFHLIPGQLTISKQLKTPKVIEFGLLLNITN